MKLHIIAIIGTRAITKDRMRVLCDQMVAYILGLVEKLGISILIIRSGNAEGVDQVANMVAAKIMYEKVEYVMDPTGKQDTVLLKRRAGAPHVYVEHYLPWSTYNKECFLDNPYTNYFFYDQRWMDGLIHEHFTHVRKFEHVNPRKYYGILKMARRNALIVYGSEDLDPCHEVLWHTWDGLVTGGTRYGVIFARNRRIPDKKF